jgi:hypothetical protein
MSNLSLRGLEPDVLAELKACALKENASVNSIVLRLINKGLGRQASKPARKRHHDLDALAGSWSPADAADFQQATRAFDTIDPGLWK